MVRRLVTGAAFIGMMFLNISYLTAKVGHSVLTMEIAEKHTKKFEDFVYEKKNQLANLDVFGARWFAMAMGYSREDLDNSGVLKRLFQNETVLQKFLKNIGTSQDIAFVNTILQGLFTTKNHWDILQGRLHEATLTVCKLPHHLKRHDMKDPAIVNGIDEEAYFTCMLRNLYALYWYEHFK
jgi:hypothetical protein